VAGDERVIDYLREARADELALARTLKAQIAAAPRGEYRDGLRGYLDETRTHARRVHGRLDDLGAAEGVFRSGARFLREAGGGVLALGRVPLKGVAREKRKLRGAQFGCATEGLVIATYTALEVVADRAGDRQTAQLASDIRAEEERMLEWLRHEIVKLTDPFIRQELEVTMDDVQRALIEAERRN
jgi:ferritin-like metal-binding protein YciE